MREVSGETVTVRLILDQTQRLEPEKNTNANNRYKI
jgi:hypothetical protein